MVIPNQDWIDSHVEKLLCGQKLLIRGHAFSGRTDVLSRLASASKAVGAHVEMLGETSSQADIDEALVRLERSAISDGFAILIVDDLDLMIFSETGRQRHARINVTLSAPETSKSIGLIASALDGTQLIPTGGPCSAIYDLFQSEMFIPLASTDSLVASYQSKYDCSVPEAEGLAGHYGTCFPLARPPGAFPSHKETTEFAIRVAQRMISGEGARLEHLVALQRLAKSPGAARGDEGLRPAVHVNRDGKVELPTVLRESDLLEVILAGGVPWPRCIDGAAARFRCRVGPARRAIWVDRYVGLRVAELVALLDRISGSHPGLRLELLTGVDFARDIKPTEAKLLRERVAHWKTQHLDIEIRKATGPAVHEIHDRQLLFPFERGGFALPPADRVTCCYAPGNATDSYLDAPRTDEVVRIWYSSPAAL